MVRSRGAAGGRPPAGWTYAVAVSPPESTAVSAPVDAFGASPFGASPSCDRDRRRRGSEIRIRLARSGRPLAHLRHPLVALEARGDVVGELVGMGLVGLDDPLAAVLDAGAQSAPSAPPVAGEPPAAGEGVGRLQLSIRPGDTAVYLDGQFLGTGDELSQLSAGLVVEPGEHVLELVRPGYATEQVPIKVPAGERIDVDLTLRQR